MRICDDCGGTAYRNRNVCNTCKNNRFKKNNPHKYFYGKLKNNAKRRGKEFTITLEDFIEFCQDTEYLDGKGRGATSFHIDRDDETKGYVKGNLKKRTNIENVRKYIEWSGKNEHGENEFTTKTAGTSKSDDHCPF